MALHLLLYLRINFSSRDDWIRCHSYYSA